MASLSSHLPIELCYPIYRALVHTGEHKLASSLDQETHQAYCYFVGKAAKEIMEDARTVESHLYRFIRKFAVGPVTHVSDCFPLFKAIKQHAKLLDGAYHVSTPSPEDVRAISQRIEDAALEKVWPTMCDEIVSDHLGLSLDRKLKAKDIRAWLNTHQNLLQTITLLNLAALNLVILPPEIKYFRALQILNISSNRIVTLPPEIRQLTSLNVLMASNNSLTSLPPEMGELRALIRLDLSKNCLKELPPQIGQLIQLMWLELEDNRLNKLPAEIGMLVALQHLYLNNNQLTTLPPEIGQLAALQELFLSHNRLIAIPSTIGNLHALHKFRLVSNALTQLPDTIGQLAALQELDLTHNHLTSLPHTFAQLGVLQRLEVMSNQLRAVPSEIYQMPALQLLNLNSNLISELPPIAPGQLPLLQELILLGNQLTRLPQGIGHLVSLQSLIISHNHLSELPHEIGGLLNLQTLLLNNNLLTTLPPSMIQMSSLHMLTLFGNRFTELPGVIVWLESLSHVIFSDNPLRTSPLEIIVKMMEHEMYVPLYFFLSKQPYNLAAFRARFHGFRPQFQHKIFEWVWILSGKPQTSDRQWGQHHAFDDADTLRRAFVHASKDFVIPTINSEYLYHTIYCLAGCPATDDLQWGEHHVLDDPLRFMAALDIVTTSRVTF